MSLPTVSTTDMYTLLERLKKKFEETFEDVHSTRDFKKMIDHLMHQAPLAQQCEQDLRERYLQLDGFCKTEPSKFRSIREELAHIHDFLRKEADKADHQDDFQAFSATEQKIIDQPDTDPIVKCLRVSYEFFLRPDELKHDPRICLFLAIFPQNVVLRKRFLIYWWIGEGFVPNEEEGERVFYELLDLELLIPCSNDKCPRVSKCQISRWARYLLISEAQKEKLLMNLVDGIPRFDPTHSKRACLIANHTNLASDLSESTLGSLRTIFNVNERDLDFAHQNFTKLNKLGVLQLGRWQVSPTHHIEVRDKSFLTSLKTQKYLKYLSLRGISRITSLPDSIRELVSLQILDLKACHNLETLPEAIASLEKLTHLDVSECYLLDSMPKGIFKLKSLQVLKGFIIWNSKKSPICLLQGLENLRRLSIHIGSEATIEKEEFDLKRLKKLECLKVSWGKASVGGSLSLPSRLKKLDLEGIPHDKMPEWLKPKNLMELETLYIKGGKLSNLLDDEGEQWNNVKYLVLKYTKMKPIDIETLRSVFRSLQYVKDVKWDEKGEQDSVEFEWINEDGAVRG